MNKILLAIFLLFGIFLSGCSTPCKKQRGYYNNKFKIPKEKTTIYWSRANNYIFKYNNYYYHMSNNHIINSHIDLYSNINKIAITKELDIKNDLINVYIVYSNCDNDPNEAEHTFKSIKKYITTGVYKYFPTPLKKKKDLSIPKGNYKQPDDQIRELKEKLGKQD